MNFVLFNVILLVAGFVAVFIFSLGLMLCLAPMALFAKWENPPKAVTLPLIGIGGIYQIYFWGFWSAFCVAMTIRFTQKPEVTWDWLYWITGFMDCTSLIGWLAHKERQSSQSLAEARGIEKGTMLYSLVAIVAFLVFSFAPSLILVPYGWALKPLGMGTYVASDIPSQYVGDRNHLSEAFRAFNEANELSQVPEGLSSYTPPPGVNEKIDNLLQKGLKEGESVSDDFLNWLHPEMKKHFREQFMKGQQLMRKDTKKVTF